MNKKSILLAAVATVAIVGNAFAYSPTNQATSTPAVLPRPVPSSVVKPINLPRYFSTTVIDVEFSIDQAGQPFDIKVKHVGDPALTRQLVAAFSQWRFEPGVSSPTAKPKRFVLPIEIRPEV